MFFVRAFVFLAHPFVVVCSNLRGFLLKPSWFIVSNLRVFWLKPSWFLLKPSCSFAEAFVFFCLNLRVFAETFGFFGRGALAIQRPPKVFMDFQVCTGIWFEGGVGIIRMIPVVLVRWLVSRDVMF